MLKIVEVDGQGRIVIPKKVRDLLGIVKGTSLMLRTYPAQAEKPTKILLELIGT